MRSQHKPQALDRKYPLDSAEMLEVEPENNGKGHEIGQLSKQAVKKDEKIAYQDFFQGETVFLKRTESWN